MVKFVIEGSLAGLNEYTQACRSNAHVGAKMKHKAEEKITAYILQQIRGKHFCKPVFIRFKWYEKNKRRDKDNICFAKKFILDALVKTHVINGDGWGFVEGFSDEFEVDAENPRIEIEIQEVDT